MTTLHDIQQRASRRRGMSLLYVVVSMSVMFAFASLAVDIGRVQVAKTEALRTADAAARAAVAGMGTSIATAQDNAVSIAASNSVDGTAVTLNTTSDIEFGTWDSTAKSFTVLTGVSRSSANAVRVNVRRTAARGNPIALTLAQILGRTSCDINSSAIAAQSSSGLQMVGLNSVNVKNNFTAATYNSSTNTNPSSSTNTGGATVGSNGAISAKNNEDVGSVLLGPSGSSNLGVSSTVLTSNIAVAAGTAPSAGSDISISGTVTYGGGTYCWRNVTLANNAELAFNGAATVYITGNITFAQNGTISAASDRPTNLSIYMTGSGSQVDADSSNNVDITADMICPLTDFSAKNNATIRGRMIFKTIYAKNNLDFYYDQSLPSLYGGSGGGICAVK